MTPSEVEHDIGRSREIERLDAALGGDPGAAAFPALSGAHRRAGDPVEAERVARAGLERRPDALAGRVALGLALLDLGRLDEARAELKRVLSSVPDHPLAVPGLEGPDAVPVPTAFAAVPDASSALDDAFDGAEIEAAFDDARPEEDQMISADSVAASAIRAAELGAPADFIDDSVGIPVATHTVADLLERQGHDSDACAMRAEIDGGQQPQIIATLERWLDNLRRTAP